MGYKIRQNKTFMLCFFLSIVTLVFCVLFYFILPHEIDISISSETTLEGTSAIAETMHSYVLLISVFVIMLIPTIIAIFRDSKGWRIVSVILFILDILTLFLV